MRQALKDFAAAAGLVLVCALLALALPVQAQVPQAAQPYRALLVRTAHAVWGLDAPVAVLAAQIHQESGWHPQAVSRVVLHDARIYGQAWEALTLGRVPGAAAWTDVIARKDSVRLTVSGDA